MLEAANADTSLLAALFSSIGFVRVRSFGRQVSSMQTMRPGSPIQTRKEVKPKMSPKLVVPEAS